MMRVGLIGCGGIGMLRAQALRATPGMVLTLVTDAVAERAAAATARCGARAVEDVAALVGSAEVDAVIVSTPPNLHRAHCEAALRSGKHVLCEKPLAPTAEECRAMVETARRSDRVLATGFNYRFYPAVAKARELIGAGAIGAIDHVTSFTGHPGGPEFTHPWVHDRRIMGGGALMDNGIHAADLTLHFLGEAAAATGLCSERVWRFPGSEDNGYVLLRTADGRVGTLHASWSEWRGYRWSIEISGTNGCIRVWYPPMLTVLHERPQGAAKRGRRRVFAFPRLQVAERLRSYRWTIVRSFVAEQLDFVRRVGGQAGVGATGADGLRAVELVSSAYSAASPSWSTAAGEPAAAGCATPLARAARG